jgi:hypothetical protein
VNKKDKITKIFDIIDFCLYSFVSILVLGSIFCLTEIIFCNEIHYQGKVINKIIIEEHYIDNGDGYSKTYIPESYDLIVKTDSGIIKCKSKDNVRINDKVKIGQCQGKITGWIYFSTGKKE